MKELVYPRSYYIFIPIFNMGVCFIGYFKCVTLLRGVRGYLLSIILAALVSAGVAGVLFFLINFLEISILMYILQIVNIYVFSCLFSLGVTLVYKQYLFRAENNYQIEINHTNRNIIVLK